MLKRIFPNSAKQFKDLYDLNYFIAYMFCTNCIKYMNNPIHDLYPLNLKQCCAQFEKTYNCYSRKYSEFLNPVNSKKSSDRTAIGKAEVILTFVLQILASLMISSSLGHLILQCRLSTNFSTTKNWALLEST